MNWLRKNLLFALVLALCTAAIGVEAWMLYGSWQRTTRAQVTLKQRKEERDWLARQSPAPSEENAAAIATDVAAGERKLAELRQTLQGRGNWLPAPPTRPLDAYFALAAFTEKARALAVRQQVELRAEERFGFASYANVGPEPELLRAVHRQRVVVEHLIESLLEARPRSLLSVQRERPLSDAQRVAARAAAPGPTAARENTSSAERTADFFQPAPHLRLHVPGQLESDAFRLEFTGQTQALRAFLNGLAAFKLPLIVRSVEVEPSPVDATAAAANSTGRAPVPLVTQNFSKFVVVVEFVEVLPAPTPANS